MIKCCLYCLTNLLHNGRRRPEGASTAVRDSQLDPEELKDALLQQAIAQRRALVASSLRKGTGRDVKRATFKIVVTLPEPRPEPIPLNLEAHTLTSSQLATAKSPSAPGLRHYPSPIEGVPERIMAAAPQVVPRPFTGGPSPMEGVPEWHSLPYGTHVGSNQQWAPANDSPVEGLVHQRAAPGGGPSLQPASGPFAFAAAPAHMDMAVQTGTSLEGSAEKAHAAYGDDAGPSAGPMDMGGADDDDDFGGADFGDDGGFGGWDDYGNDDDAAAMPPPPPLAQYAKPSKPRKPVQNPGIRLRNELTRKSLAVDPQVGRQEVGGLRRSTRNPEKPLKWWIGETKNFGRTLHKTMPTVEHVVHRDPNTPWRTVSDPRDWRKARAAAKAAAAAAGVDKKKKQKRKGAGGGGRGQGRGRGRSRVAPSRDIDEQEDDLVSSDEETELLSGRGGAGKAEGGEEEVQGTQLFGSDDDDDTPTAKEQEQGCDQASPSPATLGAQAALEEIVAQTAFASMVEGPPTTGKKRRSSTTSGGAAVGGATPRTPKFAVAEAAEGSQKKQRTGSVAPRRTPRTPKSAIKAVEEVMEEAIDLVEGEAATNGAGPSSVAAAADAADPDVADVLEKGEEGRDDEEISLVEAVEGGEGAVLSPGGSELAKTTRVGRRRQPRRRS